MRRIMIVGLPGSGKSTLAAALGKATGLPVIHVDLIHWKSGWVERSPEEKTRLCNEAEAADEWIFEGGHSATWANRLARADLLVWLDRPLGLRVCRVVRRTFSSLGRARADLPEGCPEQLSKLPEFLLWIWTTRTLARTKTAALTATAKCPVVVLRSDREAAEFVAKFRSPAPAHIDVC